MHLEYVPTHLEEWISNEYIKRGILTPSDLTISNISRCFGVETVIRNGKSYSVNIDGTIVLFLSKESRRDLKRNFHHELCHGLLHEGRQGKDTPIPLRELQENQAENFIKYSAIPYHMLSYINFTDVNYTAELFGLPVDICEERIHSIQIRQTYIRGRLFRSLLPAMSKY